MWLEIFTDGPASCLSVSSVTACGCRTYSTAVTVLCVKHKLVAAVSVCGLCNWEIVFCQQRGQRNVVLSTTFTPATVHTQPPVHNIHISYSAHPAFLLRLQIVSFACRKASGCETYHSPPTNAKVKNGWSRTSSPPIRLHSLHKGTLTLHVQFHNVFLSSVQAPCLLNGPVRSSDRWCPMVARADGNNLTKM
jgi:hypothetical protein